MNKRHNAIRTATLLHHVEAEAKRIAALSEYYQKTLEETTEQKYRI
jgi:hypothetical protein